MQKQFEIGVYYFPNYHVDPRNEKIHGLGWTEWELVKRGEPRFPGHQQPKVPLWGYEDESDPKVFARKIDAAADHGITHFIFDWYYYNDGPFLERCLHNGYMNAHNNARLKFALMWANHTWTDIHPAKSYHSPLVLYPGEVTRDTLDTMTDMIIEKYFTHPSYWKIEGCPYFSIYDLATLIRGLGGMDETLEAIRAFRRKTKLSGFPDLHLNVVMYGNVILPGEEAIQDPAQVVEKLEMDTVTSYVWIHHVGMPQWPANPYDKMADGAEAYWRIARNTFSVPYHPNVSMGWDSTPRVCQSDVYVPGLYPNFPTIEGNTPDAFKRSLERVKAFLEEDGEGHRIFNINSWNEWTEGSYIEPDTVNEMGYLEAIRQVFGMR